MAPIADYYQTEIIRNHMEEKIRTAIPASVWVYRCVAEFETCFPGYAPDWTPRDGHETDCNIYKMIAEECSVEMKCVGNISGFRKCVVTTDETFVSELKRLRPETLVAVMIEMTILNPDCYPFQWEKA